MRKIILLICLGIVLLTACQSNETKPSTTKKSCTVNQKKETEQPGTTTKTDFPYPHLLAKESGSYSLLSVGKLDEKSPIEENKKITQSVHEILSLPLDQAKKIYPNLQINNDPTYILFDKNGIAYQSTTLNDLTTFLNSHPLQ